MSAGPGEALRAAPGPMAPAEAAARFLREVPALAVLDGEALLRVAEQSFLEHLPRGSRILLEGGPPADGLRIVVTGGAKVAVRSGEGGEIVLDYRSPGDTIGFISLSGGDRSRTTVTAVEDTDCYLVPRTTFLALLDEHPAVREYFDRTFLAKYVDKAFADMHARSRLLGGGERLLFTTPVGRVCRRPAVTAPSGIAIREAASIMSRHRASSLVLTGPGGEPAGIVTDRDLRDKVAARGLGTGGPVSAIMSLGLETVAADGTCFDALMTMIRRGIHHLPVIDSGRLAGMLTNHDLMVLQGSSPLSVVRDIDGQQDVEGLARAAAKADAVAGQLLRDGARAGNIMRVVAEISDRVARRAAEIAANGLGPAPGPWCWLLLGSAGRRELAFRASQDGGLVLGDRLPPGEQEAAGRWHRGMTDRVRGALAACGYPPRPSDRSPANPSTALSAQGWEDRIAGPDAAADPGLLDFRGVAGDLGLAGRLRHRVGSSHGGRTSVTAALASAIGRSRPPLGFFGSFVVEKGGDHRDELDLEASALAPIAGVARLAALIEGIDQTGTVERLRALRGRHPLAVGFGEELVEAFEFLAMLLITRQWEQVQAGRPAGSFVNPDSLTALERQSLKDTFRLISRVQEFIAAERVGMPPDP